MSMFVLEALESVHPERTAEYEALSAKTDAHVKQTEPGMLVHAQSRVGQTPDAVLYRWLEIYRSYEDLEAHLENPAVREHINTLNTSGMLTAPIKVTITCDWSEEQKAPFLHAAGLELNFAPVVNGYFR